MPDTTPPGQTETVAFLTRLSGARPVETHISYVFLGPDTVWKLKKSVRLPFLDFTGIDTRRHFCERELALNTQSAPGLYRDVVPVVRREDASLAIGGPGEAIDWVVRLARVPAKDFLDVRAAAEGLPPPLLDRIADAVAAFHSALPPADVRPDLQAIANGNAGSAIAAGLPETEVQAWNSAMRAALQADADWRETRTKHGFVRRCHGDMHLGNLCVWQGRPVLFDALEFDEAMATIDVAYDLAFLLMDLEYRLDRTAAVRVLNRYVARTGDAGLAQRLPAFLSMRAMIRAHVEARSGHADRARQYLAAAGRYLQPSKSAVIAIGGLPGTGKSTLARALAPVLGAPPGALVLRSDEIRKRQHAAAPEQRLPKSAYTAKASAAVFTELATMVETAARGVQVVIADATFISLDHRAAIEAAARRAGAPFLGIWLTAPRTILEQRVADRTGDASDATVAVLRSATRADPGPAGWIAIDAADHEATLTQAQALARTMVTTHIAP